MNGVTRPSDSAGSNHRGTIEMPWTRVIWPDGCSARAGYAPAGPSTATASRTSTRSDRLMLSSRSPPSGRPRSTGTTCSASEEFDELGDLDGGLAENRPQRAAVELSVIRHNHLGERLAPSQNHV